MSRLEEIYKKELRTGLKQELKLGNEMEIPKITKIVLNIGVKDAVKDSKILQSVRDTLSLIAGQSAVKTIARKSIAGFKLREGVAIGARVTLRRKKMYDFLDKLINLALPGVRDFQGVGVKLDGQGNYNLGITDWMIFPEVDYDKVGQSRGLNITICTSARNDHEGFALLKAFKMPFKQTKSGQNS